MIKSLEVKSLVLVKSKSAIICQCFIDPAVILIQFFLPREYKKGHFKIIKQAY